MARATVTRQIRMDPEVYQALEEYARAHQTSVNRAIQDIVAAVVMPWKAEQQRQAQADPTGAKRR